MAITRPEAEPVAAWLEMKAHPDRLDRSRGDLSERVAAAREPLVRYRRPAALRRPAAERTLAGGAFNRAVHVLAKRAGARRTGDGEWSDRPRRGREEPLYGRGAVDGHALILRGETGRHFRPLIGIQTSSTFEPSSRAAASTAFRPPAP